MVTLDTRYGRITVRSVDLLPRVLGYVRDAAGMRAWCPGASPPDNSCPPHNKGGKGGGGGGKSGGGKAGGKSKAGTGDKGAKPAAKKPKAFNPEKSAAAIAKKLATTDARLQKKVDAAKKALDKETAARDAVTGKLADANRVMLAAERDAFANPKDKAKQRALEKAKEAQRPIAEQYRKQQEVIAKAREQHKAAIEARAQAGREVLKKEMNREIAEMAAADGRQASYAAAKTAVEKAHAQRLSRVTDAAARAEISTGLGFIREHANPEIHKIALQPKLTLQENVRAHARRGLFDAKTGDPTLQPQVVLDRKDHSSTVAHELGHCIEYTPEAAKLASDFRARRTAGEQEVSFRSKFGQRYEPEERGSPDDFVKAHLAAGYDANTATERAHYTGKRYTSGSTEVVSMGVELLKHDPATFARSDPEWFNLVTGVMTGRLLPQTRQRRAKKK